MNHKLVESYIKDRLRKQFGREATFENGIAYIGTCVEVDFDEDVIYICGYKTHTVLVLNYPEKSDNDTAIRLLFRIIMAVYSEEDS